jgi:hypothetical protein
MRQVRQISRAFALYLASWVVSFLAIVGWRPDLAPQYFVLGWTQGGLELITYVWLCSLLVFAALFVALVIRRKLHGGRGVAV